MPHPTVAIVSITDIIRVGGLYDDPNNHWEGDYSLNSHFTWSPIIWQGKAIQNSIGYSVHACMQGWQSGESTHLPST